MKKNLLSAICMTVMIGSTSASVLWTGSCGYETVTVGEKAFENKEETEKYYEELNEIFCGEKSDNYDIHTDAEPLS